MKEDKHQIQMFEDFSCLQSMRNSKRMLGKSLEVKTALPQPGTSDEAATASGTFDNRNAKPDLNQSGVFSQTQSSNTQGTTYIKHSNSDLGINKEEKELQEDFATMNPLDQLDFQCDLLSPYEIKSN